MQKDFVKIKTARNMIQILKESLENDIGQLRNEKLSLMKNIKVKSEELSIQLLANKRLQEKVASQKKVVDVANDKAELASFILADDLPKKEELVLEVEKLMKSKAVLKSVNDTMQNELSKCKADYEDANKKVLELTNRLAEFDIEKEKSNEPIVKENELMAQEYKDNKSSETIIESIIQNIQNTMNLHI